MQNEQNKEREYYFSRLRDLRKDCELTQREVADILQTSYQYYQKYEKGIRPIPVDRLIKLSKFYHVSTDYILGLSKEKNSLEDDKKGKTVTFNQKGGKHKTDINL